MKSKTVTTRIRARAGRGSWILVSESLLYGQGQPFVWGKFSFRIGGKEELALLLDPAKCAEREKELEITALITPHLVLLLLEISVAQLQLKY